TPPPRSARQRPAPAGRDGGDHLAPSTLSRSYCGISRPPAATSIPSERSGYDGQESSVWASMVGPVRLALQASKFLTQIARKSSEATDDTEKGSNALARSEFSFLSV